LLTEDTIRNLLENNPEKYLLRQQLESDKFFLLITPIFNALLYQEKDLATAAYQVSVIFDSAVITDKLIQFAYKQKWKINLIESLRTQLGAKLTKNKDRESSTDFILKAVKLLINSAEQSERHYSQYSTPQMENLLHYQVEQEKSLSRLKIQIAQNLNLSEIIQTAISRSCNFLESDRLLVYQLGVTLKLGQINNIESVKNYDTVDTVTYEARSSEKIASTLYLHEEEGCWAKTSACRKKYRQGFGLVIDDLTADGHLDPCLQSLMMQLQVKAKVVIPVNVRGKIWGLIIAHQCEPRTWQHQNIQFLRQLAEYLAIAIFNHQSYQQLQQQKKLLEKQVETQSQQLKDALIAAEAASKSKHDFLGSMSHELRTPLTCVIGLSSTLLQWSSTKQKMHLSPEKQHEYLHLIQQSGKHLLSLINNILEFSDVESGKHLLEIQQVSLPEVVKQTLHLLQDSAEAKSIELRSEVRIEPEKNSFFADEIRLKEILFHILSNGIKFTPQGGKVTLRVWREKHRVVFQIEDTGIGIAPDEIPLLFEKFKQIENVRQRVHGGTGLGLALTKKLVELHGGTIEIESALGEGAIFTVYLPEKAPLANNLRTLNPVASFPHSVPGSQTIVLITEDEASATFICQLLNTIDYQVVWLTDSAMAVNQIELLQPRIVIFDQDCSMMDVQQIVKAIANASLTDYTRVSLLCDRVEHDEWQKFTKCGVDEYLLKSMNPTQIINKINNLSQKEVHYEQLQDG
ncbi:MAG: GAF domain-containing protein, partial [Hydrococcus sp. SU_1_0]|nr:GAF domain-containing protein [Hydrococcus sp. SU_1_0]